MGTDIHTFIEYKVQNNKKVSWRSFSDGAFWLERDYTMFYILAQVRSEKTPKSFKAKGKVPFNQISNSVRDGRMASIGEYNEEYGGCIRGYTKEQAIEFKKKFGCRIQYICKNPYWVDEPDYHSDTWLTFSEYSQALQYYEDYTKETPPIGYLAVYEIMKVYENAGHETRLIVFFDN